MTVSSDGHGRYLLTSSGRCQARGHRQRQAVASCSTTTSSPTSKRPSRSPRRAPERPLHEHVPDRVERRPHDRALADQLLRAGVDPAVAGLDRLADHQDEEAAEQRGGEDHDRDGDLERLAVGVEQQQPAEYERDDPARGQRAVADDERLRDEQAEGEQDQQQRRRC